MPQNFLYQASKRDETIFGQVSILSGEISRGNLAAERVLEVLNSTPTMPLHGGKVPTMTTEGHVVFEGVEFTYSSRPDVPIFRGIHSHTDAFTYLHIHTHTHEQMY